MYLWIDLGTQRGPCGPRGSDPVDTALVFQRKFVPKCAAGLHLVIPWDVVKPEQKLFGTSLNISELLLDGQMILAHRVATCLRPIKPDAKRIRLVIVDWVPIVALFRIPPRRRPVVMSSPKEMMQTKRCHVVHNRIVRFEHQSRY